MSDAEVDDRVAALSEHAAELRLAARSAEDHADEADICAVLLEALPAALSAAAAAGTEAAELRQIADHTQGRLDDLLADIAQMQRRYAVCAAAVDDQDKTVRVEARITRLGLGEELDALATRLEPAEAIAAHAAAEAAEA